MTQPSVKFPLKFVFLSHICVSIVDTTPPTITGCPDNQEIIVELGITSAPAFWTVPTATDLSGQVTIVGTPPQPGQSVMVGTMTVLYTFQDMSMNQAFCEFTITVTPGKDIVKLVTIVHTLLNDD